MIFSRRCARCIHFSATACGTARSRAKRTCRRSSKVRDVLESATVEGAKGQWSRQQDRTLTPGKEADIILLRTDRFNVMPMNNAAGAVVSSMSPGNVDTVLIGGQVKKRNGQLVGVDVEKVAKLVSESRDRTLGNSKI